jgi:hypothetical protein
MRAGVLRSHLPKRFRARVKNPIEMRMGSPQYGQLVLDGHVVRGLNSVEADSLVWSGDGRQLAVQELVSWADAPKTRVAVVDTTQRACIAASRARNGLSTPVSFESGALVYRHWSQHAGEQTMHLRLDAA